MQCACVSKLSKNCCARQACFLAGLLARFCTDSQLFFAHSVKGSCFQGRSDGDVRTIRICDWRLWERRKSFSEIVKMWKDWNGGIKYIWEVWFSESDGNGGFCSRQSCSAADLMEVGEEEDWAVRGENITQVPLLDFQSLSCLPLSQNQQCALSMMIITIRRGMGTAPSSLTGMEPQMQLHFHWWVPFFSQMTELWFNPLFRIRILTLRFHLCRLILPTQALSCSGFTFLAFIDALQWPMKYVAIA